MLVGAKLHKRNYNDKKKPATFLYNSTQIGFFIKKQSKKSFCRGCLISRGPSPASPQVSTHPKCRDACNASASNEGNILTQHTRSPAHPAHKVTCAPSSTSPRSPQPTRAGQFAGCGRIACVPTLWVRGHA